MPKPSKLYFQIAKVFVSVFNILIFFDNTQTDKLMGTNTCLSKLYMVSSLKLSLKSWCFLQIWVLNAVFVSLFLVFSITKIPNWPTCSHVTSENKFLVFFSFFFVQIAVFLMHQQSLDQSKMGVKHYIFTVAITK